MKNFRRELTPLTEGDCFLVFDRKKRELDFPVHFHPEYELNFIYNASGARRIIGDHLSIIDKYELVLIGPNLYHFWDWGNAKKTNIHEITIQFQHDLFHNTLLNKNIMRSIKELLDNSSKGIAFSKNTILSIKNKIERLSRKKGVNSLIELIHILNVLANSKDKKILSSMKDQTEEIKKSDRISVLYDYIEHHFHDKISLDEVAEKLNMTVITFTRFIKHRTGKTFIEFLTEYRISKAIKLLLDTNQTISDIAFSCGFNNQSHFNHLFKRRKGCSPSAFKKNFSDAKKYQLT